jgi:hypothetical protein
VAAAVKAGIQQPVSHHLGQGFVWLWSEMCDLGVNNAAVRKLAQGEKNRVCQMVAYFSMPAMFQVLLNILPRFTWLHKHVLLSEKKAIAALIAAWNLAALSRRCTLRASCHGSC